MAPKATRHGGGSDIAQSEGTVADASLITEFDQPKTDKAVEEGSVGWDGNSSSTSSGTESTTGDSSSQSDQSPAPSMESPSTPDQTGSSSADSTGGEKETLSDGDEPDPYDKTNAELEAELERRGLAKTGNKAEMQDRLRQDDADKAAAAQDPIL